MQAIERNSRVKVFIDDAQVSFCALAVALRSRIRKYLAQRTARTTNQQCAAIERRMKPKNTLATIEITEENERIVRHAIWSLTRLELQRQSLSGVLDGFVQLELEILARKRVWIAGGREHGGGEQNEKRGGDKLKREGDDRGARSLIVGRTGRTH